MKYWKVLLSILFCFVLFAAALQPIRAEAAELVTVYLDPANGSDSADGLTEATAVKTFEAAYAIVKTGSEGKIVFLSTLTLDTETRLPSAKSSVPVTLTSKTGAEGISANNNVRFMCPTTVENITFTMTDTGTNKSNRAICGEGNKLVIGENVTSVATDGYYFNIHGGARWAKCASTDVTVTSGTWRNIYVGTYGYSSGTAGVTGNAKLTVTGGKLTGFIAPSYTSNAVIGSVDISLSNISLSSIYCAGVSNGTINGDVNVTLGENVTLSGSLYAGGNGSGSVTGTVTVIQDGADTTGWSKLSGGGASDFTGTVGAAKLLLKTGTVGKAPVEFTSVDVDIPEGKTLTVSKCMLTANTVKSAGTLAFAGAGKLVAEAVTGTVNCTVSPKLNNIAYITAPAGSGFVFADNAIPENNGVWINHDLENFQGLVLTAEEGVTTTLYTGFNPDSSSVKKVEPYAVVGNTKYFPALEGKYYYRASGTGYYTVKHNLYMSPEEAMTKTVEDATPGKKAGNGWESSNVTIRYYTDEFLAKVTPSDKTLWPEFADLFTTPAFGEDRAEHQHTTQQEMEEFIAKLDSADDNMYVYSMGTSGYGQDMPLVIFTRLDLTGKTLEEAAALVVADSQAKGKLTVHHQAHMHGTEPASGEAVLGMIQRLDGAYGESLLDSMNIYVMPRLNPDGAKNNVRSIPTWDLKDPNSDMLQLETKEMQNVARAMTMFAPHVFLDNHEYTATGTTSTATLYDMYVSPGYTTQTNDDFRELALTMVKETFNALEEKDFSYNYYSSIVNNKNMSVGRGYAANQGMLAFLMESQGINYGNNCYERRVVGQMICLTTFYNYMRDNLAEVKSTIVAEQQRIINDGKTFEESDIVVLKSGETSHPELAVQVPNHDAGSGEFIKMVTITPTVQDDIIRTRPAPTAYVIPAGESWVQAVMTIMDRHGIAYTKLPAGQTVMLRQYTGSRTEAQLADETAVNFPNGAYVFCMNQLKAEILTGLLEPDLTDAARTLTSSNGRLTATSDDNHTYISPVDGVFPIYRYEHDLNAEGFIDSTDIPAAPTGLTGVDISGETAGKITGLDANKRYEYRLDSESRYTSVPAGATEITGLAAGKYYVRFQASGSNKASADAAVTIKQYYNSEYAVYLSAAGGADTNDGYSEAAAVKTLGKACDQLDALMQTAPEGAMGMVVLLDTVTLPNQKIDIPSHDYTLIITGKTGAERFDYKGGGSQATQVINLGGDTILQKLTLKLTNSSTYNYICACGHKLIVGEDVTGVTNSAGAYFNLVGGAYGTDTVASTDIVVHSGSWRQIYVGNYASGKVTGDAKLTMDGGTVTNYIQSGYGGTVNGNVIMDLANVTVGSRITGGATHNGLVKGDTTVILRQGVEVTKVYAAAGSANINGTFTLIVDGADLTDSALYGKSSSTGTVGKSVLEYKSGTLGAYSDFTEFVDNSAIRGDMNGDGQVTDADALYLLRHTLFSDRYPIDQSGDVNGDSQVTDADALYLLRFTLFPERYPLN